MKRFIIGGIALVGVIAIGVPAVVHADALGDVRTFKVGDAYDVNGATTIGATLRAVGAQAYFYVDDRFWATLAPNQQSGYGSQLQTLATEFDIVIWPRETALWGTEARPGVDGDPHVVILLEQLKSGNGGYFQTIDNYSTAQTTDGNAREMFYVAVDSIGTNTARDFVAHEFQHLISFNQKELLQGVSEDVWLNEARSEYTDTIVGYAVPFDRSTLQRRASTFLRTPSDSLVAWPNTSTDYGIASMVIHYLADQYGQPLLQQTLHAPLAGVASINSWLAQHSSGERFADVFTNWMVAVLVNDRSIGDAFGYLTQGLDRIHVVPDRLATLSNTAPVSWSLTAEEWQPFWIRMYMPTSISSPTMTVTISGDAAQYHGAVVAEYSGTTDVIPWDALTGTTTVYVPTTYSGAVLTSATLLLTYVNDASVQNRSLVSHAVTVSATLDPAAALVVPTPTPTPAPTALRDGDLMHRIGQPETYVIWGPYRRYLTPGILALYGFQNRPVTEVSDGVFFRYQTSNYIRPVDNQEVYAVWPDGTKHWLHITAAQWDASGRDWGAIFIVNNAEANFYRTGTDITR